MVDDKVHTLCQHAGYRPPLQARIGDGDHVVELPHFGNLCERKIRPPHYPHMTPVGRKMADELHHERGTLRTRDHLPPSKPTCGKQPRQLGKGIYQLVFVLLLHRLHAGAQHRNAVESLQPRHRFF